VVKYSGAAANETASATKTNSAKNAGAHAVEKFRERVHDQNAEQQRVNENEKMPQRANEQNTEPKKHPPSAPCTSPTEKTRLSARHARLHAACTVPCKNSRDGKKTRLLGSLC
jgi:hypothetical protein